MTPVHASATLGLLTAAIALFTDLSVLLDSIGTLFVFYMVANAVMCRCYVTIQNSTTNGNPWPTITFLAAFSSLSLLFTLIWHLAPTGLVRGVVLGVCYDGHTSSTTMLQQVQRMLYTIHEVDEQLHNEQCRPLNTYLSAVDTVVVRHTDQQPSSDDYDDPVGVSNLQRDGGSLSAHMMHAHTEVEGSTLCDATSPGNAILKLDYVSPTISISHPSSLSLTQQTALSLQLVSRDKLQLQPNYTMPNRIQRSFYASTGTTCAENSAFGVYAAIT